MRFDLGPARRILRPARWVIPTLLIVFLGFVWLEAGREFGYMTRVLAHRESSTEDYRWKAAARVAPSSAPVRWPEARDCSAVVAAFAAERDVPDMDAYLRAGGTLGRGVVRNGAIVCEWYGNGGAAERPAAAFSVSKTVTALLLARAVAAGKIHSLDDAITNYLPMLRLRDPRFAAITVAALIDMRSGIGFDEDTKFPWVNRDAPAVYYASDLARTVVERPRIVAPPGRFLYNDYAPNLAGLALERATGARLAEETQSVWSDLGAEAAAAWSVDDLGFAWHESGFVVAPRDLARLGQLILDGGMVGDRQVAPPAWVTRSLDPIGRAHAITFADTDLGYRNGWWVLGDQALIAMGRWGQIMVVSPSTRTVIVRMGLDGHDETNVSIARRLVRVAARLRR